MGLTAPRRMLEFWEVAAPRAVGAGDASTVCGGAALGTECGALPGAALAGVAASASSRHCQLRLMQPKQTARNQLLSPHVRRRSSDKRDCLACSHHSPILLQGDNASHRTGTVSVSPLGSGPECVMWVSPSMEHPHTPQGHPINPGSLVLG